MMIDLTLCKEQDRLRHSMDNDVSYDTPKQSDRVNSPLRGSSSAREKEAEIIQRMQIPSLVRAAKGCVCVGRPGVGRQRIPIDSPPITAAMIVRLTMEDGTGSEPFALFSVFLTLWRPLI